MGKRRQTPKGVLLEGNYPDSYCGFDFGGGDDGRLADALRALLSSLSPSRDFIRSLRESGGSAVLAVIWYPNGDTGEVLGAGLLSGMADLGIDLGINVYDDRARDDVDPG